MPADHGTPTGGGERRAEIEAIVRELKHNDECGPGPVSESEYRADAEAIIAALDRVRDARNDEAAERLRKFARNLPAEASETYRGAFFDAAEVVAQSPQGEDHEAVRPDPWQASGDPSGETHLAARFPQGHTRACAAGEIDSECPCEAVPLSAEDDERHARWEFEQSRSPQGEDHE